ncbi:MAG: LysM peptidoglycan-binding domain-containing protein [Acidobacteriota bacterium]|nr:LysM peptidoglycan-binding domain-containing protein [Acidobacteriota bacterium]MDH3786252.1 LysM peptidoglycan-binding domain-containing protein [Acidobacteriota bacterium]
MRQRLSHFSIAFTAVLVLLAIASGCAGTIPQEVVDVNRALQDAKDACATVYATDSLSGVQSGVDSMNALADDNRYRKARKEAGPLASRVSGLETEAASARTEAKSAAETAIANAEALVEKAHEVEADEYAPETCSSLRAKVNAAKEAAADPCRYTEATGLAGEAAELAERAAAEAEAEKKRRAEEEKRRLEEERLKAEEEARRAEEERLRRFPSSYTVQRGDSLWRIAAMETIYGNPTYWPLLYQANESAISDPNLIYPGQELTVRRDLTEEQTNEALRGMWRSMAAGAEE